MCENSNKKPHGAFLQDENGTIRNNDSVRDTDRNTDTCYYKNDDTVQNLDRSNENGYAGDNEEGENPQNQCNNVNQELE